MTWCGGSIAILRDAYFHFLHNFSSFQPKINTDITTTQVALNYVVAKGGVPLAEVNSPKQAEEVLGCMGWVLNDDDISMLDAAADLCK
jgi:aryl-alcohol dehydrogenase-like predicted oxidoreductase